MIRGRITRQRRFGEVGIGGEKIAGLRVQIGKVRAAAAGDEDLFARPLRALQHCDPATAPTRFDRGHQARGARAEDEDIRTVLFHGANCAY